ncbi:hypothetical protein PGTUg99_004128 [Puccinia graminis f. sp. tritici]|uniref:Uncharacterized protein n=2 Tax=Puccinia graminis f. sp. tritici TaxID=56615 RepID=A0A5B0RIA6_PUCGR|nr:hypothetical protein PGTUg99_004128 [Puccinia graminis f. sp. tritici]
MLKISFHLLCFLLIRKCLTMEAGIRKCSTMEAAQPAQGSSLLNKLGELEAKYLPRPPHYKGPHSFNLRPAQEVADFQNNNALCSELPESEKAIWYIDEKTIGASSENDSNFYDLYPGQAVAERKDKNPARREASIVEMANLYETPGSSSTSDPQLYDLRLKREATKSKNESSDFRGLSQVEIACSLPRHERRPGSSSYGMKYKNNDSSHDDGVHIGQEIIERENKMNNRSLNQKFQDWLYVATDKHSLGGLVAVFGPLALLTVGLLLIIGFVIPMKTR